MQGKCINDRSEEYPNYLGKLSSNKLAGLTEGQIYPVEQSKEYEGYFEVIDNTGLKVNYKKERFKVMEDKIMVKCNVDFLESLTFCKDYELNKQDDKRYWVINDFGNRTGYPKEYFIEATTAKIEIPNCRHQIKKMPVDYKKQCEKLSKLLAASEDHNKIFSQENERLKKEIKDKDKTIIVKYIDNDTPETIKGKIYKAREDGDYYYVEDEAFLSKKYWGATGYLKNHFEKIENEKIIEEYINLKYKENQQEKDKIKECYNNYCGGNENGICSNDCHIRITKDMDYDNKKAENKRLIEDNQYINKELGQLRDELQQSEFEIKKYKASEIGYKTIIVNLIEVNKELAKNIYVEELED